MSDEIQTPEQIRADEKARVSGFIDGCIASIVANWKLITLITGLTSSLLGVNHFDSHNAAQAAQAEAESGTNWIGHAMQDAHNEIYSNRDAFLAYSNAMESKLASIAKQSSRKEDWIISAISKTNLSEQDLNDIMQLVKERKERP